MCSRKALDAHNARRRANREIRRRAAQWAANQGQPDEVVEQLRHQPPGYAKQWLKDQGLDPAVFLAPAAAPVEAAESPLSGSEAWRQQWWCSTDLLSSQIVAASNLPVRHPAEQDLRTVELDHLDWPDSPGTNDTSKAVLVSGEAAYHKTFSGIDTGCAETYGHEGEESVIQPLHEVAAWRLAEAMGEPWSTLVPPTVLRELNGEIGSLQAHRSGTNPLNSAALPDDQAVSGGLFDALVGQQDRHAGNMLVSSDGALSLIDHGFTFAKPGDLTNTSLLVHYRHLMGRAALEPGESEALLRVVDSPDMFGLASVVGRERLAAVRDRAVRMLSAGRVLMPGEF